MPRYWLWAYYIFFALVVKWYNESMVRTNQQFDSVLEHHPTSLYLPPTSESLGFFFAAVAHQVEQQTENLCVAGSSPARGTIYMS